MVESIGYLAAALTTLAFVPQAYKVYKTKKTADLSLGLFAMLSLGVALWLAYGVLIGAMPVIIANACTLVLALYILKKKIEGERG